MEVGEWPPILYHVVHPCISFFNSIYCVRQSSRDYTLRKEAEKCLCLSTTFIAAGTNQPSTSQQVNKRIQD